MRVVTMLRLWTPKHTPSLTDRLISPGMRVQFFVAPHILSRLQNLHLQRHNLGHSWRRVGYQERVLDLTRGAQRRKGSRATQTVQDAGAGSVVSLFPNFRRSRRNKAKPINPSRITPNT